jgi:hypothetical protein
MPDGRSRRPSRVRLSNASRQYRLERVFRRDRSPMPMAKGALDAFSEHVAPFLITISGFKATPPVACCLPRRSRRCPCALGALFAQCNAGGKFIIVIHRIHAVDFTRDRHRSPIASCEVPGGDCRLRQKRLRRRRRAALVFRTNDGEHGGRLRCPVFVVLKYLTRPRGPSTLQAGIHVSAAQPDTVGQYTALGGDRPTMLARNCIGRLAFESQRTLVKSAVAMAAVPPQRRNL